MWKYRWPALVVSWVVTAIGVVVVMKIPDQYEASARIYVDTQSILKPLMAGLTVQPNVEQQVSMLSRTLISRPNVEKLIRMADMDDDYYEFDERNYCIVGRRNHKRFTLGDKLMVRVKKTDIDKRLIDLIFADTQLTVNKAPAAKKYSEEIDDLDFPDSLSNRKKKK